MKTAPAKSILYGCHHKAAVSRTKYNRLLRKAEDKEAFLKRVRETLPGLRRAVKAHPCLLSDLQILISPTGEMNLIDFDDCALEEDLTLPETKRGASHCKQMIKYLGDPETPGPLVPEPGTKEGRGPKPY